MVHSPQARGHSQSAAALFAANGLTIVLALYQHWPLAEVLWIYWAQSVIIGGFHILRILNLRAFSTTGLKFNGSPVTPDSSAKYKVALFFLMHWGIFHLVYFVFLDMYFKHAGLDRQIMLLCVIAFAVVQHAAYREQREADLRSPPNLGLVLFSPYGRIIPMHLLIVGGGMFMGSSDQLLLGVFLGLKTVVDVGSLKLGASISAPKSYQVRS